MAESLDFTSLQNAYAQLSKSLNYASEAKIKEEHDLYEQFRSASIQAFEFCFELSIRFLRRFLREHETSEIMITEMVFLDLIRLGAERGIIDDAEKWIHYRKQRNQTSHTYDGKVAQKIFETLPEFKTSLAFMIEKFLRHQ